MADFNVSSFFDSFSNSKMISSTIYNSQSPGFEIQESKEDNLYIIKFTFNKIDIKPGYVNIIYFFKVVDNRTHHYGEEINIVAITESPFFAKYCNII